MTPLDDAPTSTPLAKTPLDEGPPADTGRWGRIPAWWLGHPAIDADGLAVLAALSTYANARGECWPSQATLAAALKRSRSTVNRILGHLADAGVIGMEARRSASGGRLSCLYRLRLVPGEGPIPAAGPEEGHAGKPPGKLPVQPAAKDVASADSPCAPMRQEQPESEQTPDSHASRGTAPAKLVPANSVPEEWAPDADDRAWAEARFAGVDLDRHAEGFRLRCRAHGYRYRDVGAAWKAWLAQDAAAGKAPMIRSAAPAPELKLGAWMAAAAKLKAARDGGPTPQRWS